MIRVFDFIKHWRSTIAAKLLVKVFAFYIIITFIVTLLHMYAQFTMNKDDVNFDLSVFHSSFEPSVSDGVWNLDDEALNSAFRAIYGVPQIVGAKVVDDEGHLIKGVGYLYDQAGEVIFFDPERFELSDNDMSNPIGIFYTEKVIYHQEEGASYKVGTLTLYSSEGFILSRFQYEYIFIIISALVKTLALWLIVLWQSKPVISNPIQEFSQNIRGRNLDNIHILKPSLKTNGVHELEMLESAFNHMAKNLGQEITSRKLLEQTLIDSEARLKHALNASTEGLWIWDIGNDLTYYNSAFLEMLDCSCTDSGYDSDTWFELIHPDDIEKYQSYISKCTSGQQISFKLEYRLKTCRDGYLWILAQGKVIEHDSSGKPTLLVLSHTNISPLKEAEQRQRYLACHDPLTKLPNRQLFHEQLDDALNNANHNPCQHALLYLDLDRFKNINDSFGNAIGDQLLINVASRIQGVLREDDFVARLEGDKFVVLLKHIGGTFQASESGQKITDALKSPFNLTGYQVTISASIGIALYPVNGVTRKDLIKNADLAMYQAKQLGGARYKFLQGGIIRQATDQA